jgi:hypothetical protein
LEKNADLVILDKAPLEAPAIEINNIEIMKSIKEGATKVFNILPTLATSDRGANRYEQYIVK